MVYKRAGFTLVELLIVIVVIAILATITVVAYNGIQDRARATLVREKLAQTAKQLELDKVDRGEFAATLGELDDGVLDGPVALEYGRVGSGATGGFCLTGVLEKVTMHVRNGNTEATDGACEGHNDPNQPPPEVTYKSVQKFNQPGATTPTMINHNISYNLQPSDLVFIVYDIDFYTHIHEVSAGTTALERVYRKSMGSAGYQQIVAYQGSGFTGPQTVSTGVCYGGNSQSACNTGINVKGEYIVYVISDKAAPTITVTDTSFGSQARDSLVVPAAQTVAPNDVAVFAYVYYGNNLPTVIDQSSPAPTWSIDAVKTRASAQVGGSYDALSTSLAVAASSGAIQPGLQMPSSGTVSAGATLFVIK